MPSEVQDIERRLREASVRALNRAAADLRRDSLAEVPHGELSDDDPIPLADTVYTDEATAEHLLAEVGYTSKHAGSQHEGHATQHWKTGKPIREWEVKNRPGGGKSQYLADPLKALLPRFEHYFEEEWVKVLNG